MLIIMLGKKVASPSIFVIFCLLFEYAQAIWEQRKSEREAQNIGSLSNNAV